MRGELQLYLGLGHMRSGEFANGVPRYDGWLIYKDVTDIEVKDGVVSFTQEKKRKHSSLPFFIIEDSVKVMR